MKRIKKIVISSVLDENPDLDWIGTFDSEAKSDLAINHKERVGGGNNVFEYFNPQPGACETKEQAEEDYKRMMDYENGHWYMCCIRAKAEVQTSEDGRNWLCNTISSGGLYGVESDSGDDYFNEVGTDQMHELALALKEFGFTEDEILKADLEKIRQVSV